MSKITRKFVERFDLVAEKFVDWFIEFDDTTIFTSNENSKVRKIKEQVEFLASSKEHSPSFK